MKTQVAPGVNPQGCLEAVGVEAVEREMSEALMRIRSLAGDTEVKPPDFARSVDESAGEPPVHDRTALWESVSLGRTAAGRGPPPTAISTTRKGVGNPRQPSLPATGIEPVGIQKIMDHLKSIWLGKTNTDFPI